jgi:hypothetical protein
MEENINSVPAPHRTDRDSTTFHVQFLSPQRTISPEKLLFITGYKEKST